jgi:molybdopterin converting factor small subunit
MEMQKDAMSIHITIIAGSATEARLPLEKAAGTKLTIERGTPLYALIKEILPLGEKGKIILVNGKYVKTNYELKDGDVVQIFSSLAGG